MMSRLFSLVIALLLLSTLIFLVGHHAHTNPNKSVFTVRLEVSSQNGPQFISNEVKGHLLAAFRQIPDVTIVGTNEKYAIRVVPMQLDGGYACAYVTTLVHRMPRGEGLPARETCTILDLGIFTAPPNGLELQCKSLVAKFDAGTLQVIREVAQEAIQSWEQWHEKSNGNSTN